MISESERLRRFGRCTTCGQVRDMRSFTKSFEGRSYPHFEVYCARCRFDELVTALDMSNWGDSEAA